MPCQEIIGFFGALFPSTNKNLIEKLKNFNNCFLNAVASPERTKQSQSFEILRQLACLAADEFPLDDPAGHFFTAA